MNLVSYNSDKETNSILENAQCLAVSLFDDLNDRHKIFHKDSNNYFQTRRAMMDAVVIGYEAARDIPNDIKNHPTLEEESGDLGEECCLCKHCYSVYNRKQICALKELDLPCSFEINDANV